MFSKRISIQPKQTKTQSNIDCWLSLICFVAGLSNISKLTELSLQHGFLTVSTIYVIIALLFIIPLTYMELIVGQYNSSGSYNSWNMCRLWTGTAWAMMFVLLYNMEVYLSQTGHVLWYLHQGIQLDLPWKNDTFTLDLETNLIHHTFADYFQENVFNLEWELSGLGTLKLSFLVINFITCSIIVLVFCAATKVFRVFLYIFVLYPSLILIVLLLVSFGTNGFSCGFWELFRFNCSHFWTSSTWKHVAEMNVFSLGLGLGGLLSISSNNHFRNNVHYKAICINIIDMFVQVLHTVLFYNLQGTIAFQECVSITDLLKTRSNILFVKIPLGFSYFCGPTQLWNFMFYSCAYLSGLRSLLFMFITVNQFIGEVLPNSKQFHKSKILFLGVFVCIVNIMYTTQLGSIFIYQLEAVTKGTLVLFVLTFELFGVLYLYGIKNLVSDTFFMLGIKPSIVKISWYISPILVSILFVYSMVSLAQKQFSSNYYWLYAIQFVLFTIPILCVVVSTSSYLFYNSDKRLTTICMPNSQWGPQNNVLNTSRKSYDPNKITAEYRYRLKLYKS